MKFIIKDIEEGTFNSGNPITEDKLFRLDKDPITNVSDSITEQQITNWNTAFGWGNHTGFYAPISHSHAWGDITGKPTTFTPSTHNHDDRYYTESESDAKYELIFSKNSAFNKNFGTSSGTVAQGNDSRINNGQTAFSWGNHSGLYAALSHSHSWSQITSKPSTFTPSSHTHSWNDISGFSTTTDGTLRLSTSSGYIDIGSANSSYAHIYTDRPAFAINKELRINGDKAATEAWVTSQGYFTTLPAHTHNWASITGKPSTFTPSSHTHSWNDIIGLSDGETGGSLRITTPTGYIDVGSMNSTYAHIYTDRGAFAMNQKLYIEGDLAATQAWVLAQGYSTGGTADGNNYLTGISGSGNGTVTFTRTGLSNLTWDASHSHSWSQITSKPSTFSPSAHNHSWNDINGFSTNIDGALRLTTPSGYIDFGALNASYAHIYTDRPAFAFNKNLHINGSIAATQDWVIAQGYGTGGGTADGNNYLTSVTGSGNGTMTFGRNGLTDLTFNASHSHSWSQITSKPSTFTPTTHTHSWTDITNFSTGASSSLRITTPTGYIDIGSMNSGYAHIYTDRAEIAMNKELFIDGKQAATRDWVIAQGYGSGTGGTADGNNYLTGVSGSGNGTVTFTRTGLSNLSWSAAHSHAWNDITSKPTTFTPSTHTHAWSDINGFSTGSNSSLRITTPSGYIDVGAQNSGYAHIYTDRAEFAFNKRINAVSFYEGSLRELKENILPFNEGALKLVNDLEIVTFDRKDGSVKDKIGIIADDTDKNFLNEEGTAVDLYKTIFIQAKAIQELTARLERLEKLLQ